MILNEITQAIQQYKAALNRFNNVSQDEIDEVIYELKAAELRLNRLLRQAKKEVKTA